MIYGWSEWVGWNFSRNNVMDGWSEWVGWNFSWNNVMDGCSNE